MKNKCSYGCGKDAVIQYKNGKYCCSTSKNKCTALRKKNSDGINKNGIWNKGLTKDTDERVKKYSISSKITRMEQVKNGEYVPWNKGLDISDIRVANNIKNLIKESKKGTGSLKYNIDKYGKKDGIIKYKEINKKKAQTLSNYIRLHGEKNGIIKYELFINKKKKYYSKISQELFNIIDNKHCYFGENEFGLRDNDKYYFYDFVNTKNKKVIEFNGDDFHANPKKYNSTDIPLQFINKTSEEIWAHDKNKLNRIIKEGYDVLIIWESDYKSNKDKSINKCINFLNKKSDD